MRKYTIKDVDFGNKPSAGFAQKLIKMVSYYDGWQAIMFLREFFDRETPLEDEDGEIFFCFNELKDSLDLEYRFFDNEEDMMNYGNPGDDVRYFRFFSCNCEFGLEELEMI